MTWTPPQAAPASYAWLEKATPEQEDTLTYGQFLQICYEWIDWQRALGVTDEMLDPASWVRDGDLQSFSNVVSWWPKTGVPVHMHAPTLASMVTALRVLPPSGAGLARTSSFSELLAWRVETVKAHVRLKGGDTENPNETSEERARRKNRERQAKWQLEHRAGSDDPALNALIEDAKLQAKALTDWKAYLRKYVKDQKLVCDAAVRAARQARDDNIRNAEQAIVDQEIRMLEAKDAVSNYSSK